MESWRRSWLVHLQRPPRHHSLKRLLSSANDRVRLFQWFIYYICVSDWKHREEQSSGHNRPETHLQLLSEGRQVLQEVGWTFCIQLCCRSSRLACSWCKYLYLYSSTLSTSLPRMHRGCNTVSFFLKSPSSCPYSAAGDLLHKSNLITDSNFCCIL